ncbi:MAG: S1 family peptidase [Myxococcales bacterium]|nr:S1 family peptidase [Myxococcales bacterium]
MLLHALGRTVGLGGATLGLGLVACAPAGPPDDPGAEGYRTGETSQPIQGGYADETDKGVVGLVHWSPETGLGGLCSGSLIARNVILTARHCVAASPQQIQCASAVFEPADVGSAFWVTTYPSYPFVVPPRLPQYHQGKEVVVAPGSDEFCGYDMALLVLADPIDPSEAKALVPAVDAPFVADAEYHAIGYGKTSDADNAPMGTRNRLDGLHVRCVAADCPSGYEVATQELQGDTGICSGDSGGPAVDTKGRVGGVVSRGLPGCTYPIYGHVHSWAQWIADTTAAAALEAGLPPPLWSQGFPTDPDEPVYAAPLGASCTAPSDCPGMACENGLCSRPCDDMAPCPTGYTCAPDTQNCVPTPPPPEPEEERSGGCAIGVRGGGIGARSPGDDPTKPVPWWVGVGLALALVRRLGRRR